MAIEPKTTREHIISLYGHMTGIKKDIYKTTKLACPSNFPIKARVIETSGHQMFI